MLDLHVLGYPEHDMVISRKCLSACEKNFVITELENQDTEFYEILHLVSSGINWFYHMNWLSRWFIIGRFYDIFTFLYLNKIETFLSYWYFYNIYAAILFFVSFLPDFQF